MDLSSSPAVTSCAAAQELPHILGNPRSIATFTKNLHQSLYRASLVKSMPPPPITPKSILPLSSRLRLDLHFSQFILHILSISSSLTWPFQLNVAKGTSYEVTEVTVPLKNHHKASHGWIHEQNQVDAPTMCHFTDSQAQHQSFTVMVRTHSCFAQ
jgi:hypothetical protein